MRSELEIMQRRLKTMIYVAHDQLEALSMADRIAVMRDGVLQQVGTPTEIYNHPDNQWVASFIGEPAMNFIDCLLEDKGGQLHVSHTASSLPLDVQQVFHLQQTWAMSATLARTHLAGTCLSVIRASPFFNIPLIQNYSPSCRVTRFKKIPAKNLGTDLFD